MVSITLRDVHFVDDQQLTTSFRLRLLHDGRVLLQLQLLVQLHNHAMHLRDAALVGLTDGLEVPLRAVLVVEQLANLHLQLVLLQVGLLQAGAQLNHVVVQRLDLKIDERHELSSPMRS